MKNNFDEQFERILDEGLKLREQGMSVSEIVSKFPEQADELREIFQITEIIYKRKEQFAPSENLLRKILRALPNEARAAGFMPRVSSLFRWPALPYAMATVAVILALTLGFELYRPVVDHEKTAIDEQPIAKIETGAETAATKIVAETVDLEKNLTALKKEISDFDKELSEIEKIANDKSFDNLDSLLSKIDGEIM